jgi:HD superfamily phosphohydrolase
MNKLILKHKRIFDIVHGDIHISNWATAIIDTSYFQRLRYLHQLGVIYLVFPNGDHSRFEHSLGTYFLTGKILDVIKQNTLNDKLDLWLRDVDELKYFWDNISVQRTLTDKLCELIKIAALCHDLGHGPFSHIFDDNLIPIIMKDVKNKFKKHEYRSGKILELIIIENSLLRNNISEHDLYFIKSLIDPNKNNTGFLYQIVSNSLNGLDVDKYDYLSRDIILLGKDMHFDYLRLISEIQIIDNIICYPKQLYYEIVNLFHTRYQLHKTIYNHKAVIAIQLMMTEIMIKLNPILNIALSIQYEQVDNFCKLTDSFILNTLELLSNPPQNLKFIDNINNIKEAYEIYQRIINRQLYKLVLSQTSIEPIVYNNMYNDKNKYDIYQIKIGYISGNKENPLDNIYFYNTKDIQNKNFIKFKMNHKEVSILIPDVYQEYILMIYKKNEIIFT